MAYDVFLIEPCDHLRERFSASLAEGNISFLALARADDAIALTEVGTELPPLVLVTGLHSVDGLDGLTLAARIRLRRPAMGTIYLTCLPKSALHLYMEPNTVFLQKPVIPSTLVYTLHWFLDRCRGIG